MVTSQQKGAVEELWNLFRSAGVSNPLSALEQISYLIALKWSERGGGGAVKSGPGGKASVPRWADFRKARAADLPAMVERAVGRLRSIDLYGRDFEAAMRDATLRISNPHLLRTALEKIDALPFDGVDIGRAGESYEQLLSLAFGGGSGKNSLFLTPRHVVRTMVELADPQEGEKVCDPAAGTGGFLIAAYRRMYEAGVVPAPDDFTGYDFDTTVVRLGVMNMLLHGIPRPEYRHQDMLGKGLKAVRKYDLVLSFLPFGVKVNRATIDKSRLKLKTDKTELLFVEQCLALLKNGGRCAVVVPEGVLGNVESDVRGLRRALVEENRLEAVISLPRGSFLPYTAVKTAILLVTKGGGTERVWFYDVAGDGYTLDDRREPDPEHDDLKFVPQAYRVLVRGKQERWASRGKDAAAQRSLFVSRGEIVANDYSLTSGLYRRAAEEETHADVRAIISRVLDLQSQLRRKVKKIEAQLAEALDV